MTKEVKMFESSNAKEKFCSYYAIEMSYSKPNTREYFTLDDVIPKTRCHLISSTIKLTGLLWSTNI